MHKIITLISPAEGHFNPFVPIIIKLIERRHEVICITGRTFKQRVEDIGATYFPLPEKWDPRDMEIYDFFPELKQKKGLSQVKYYIKHVLFDPIPAPLDQNYKKPAWWSEIEKDLPVVLINQGTNAKNYDDLIKPAIGALKDENMIVLALPVKEGKIHNLPDNTFTEPYIPFGNILPFVDILVTNGGFGGIQNALAHGIPVVIAGATEDKMEVAVRVENTGAGINLRKQKPSPENIKNAVKKIMSDPSYKQKAMELKAEYAKYDAPALTVDLVEELIEKQMSKAMT